MSNEWQKTLITEDRSIRNALEVINGEYFRMAFVLGACGTLIGSISDGDIRRALLGGLTLDDSLSCVMNKSPKTVKKGTSKAKIKQVMDREQINCIPVIERKKVVSIITRADLDVLKLDHPVFLMAGGFGKRLRPLTESCPKPLLKIGDTPILEIILERFVHAGFRNFYISTHYLSEQFQQHFGCGEKWGVSITYINEDTPLGTAGALGFLKKDEVTLPMIVMNGDILTGVNFSELLASHLSSEADATLCVSDYEYEIPFGVVSSDGENVSAIVEKPTHKVAISSGIYVLDPCVVNSVKKNKPLDMPTLLRKVIAGGRNVNTFKIYEHWLDVGRKEDFDQAQNSYNKNVIPLVGRGA